MTGSTWHPRSHAHTLPPPPSPPTHPCTGRIVGSVPLQLVDGVSVLLVATGRIARGPGAVAPQVLLCPDTAPQAASCTPIPVTPGR